MMKKNTACFDDLKTILKNIRNPEALNDHPWTQSLIVQEARVASPQLERVSSGQQLVSTIAQLFSTMQPPAPPRHGKRLDPRWGEFGLLAALYFAPLKHGTPFPASLLEAWERIDTAILYTVYGKPAETLAPDEIKKYQLVGAEIEYGAASTLSDWHKKGLQRLTEVLLDHEQFLSHSSSKSSVILRSNTNQSILPEPLRRWLANIRKNLPVIKRTLALVAALCLVLALIFGGLKARQLYRQGLKVYGDVTHLQALASSVPETESLTAVGPALIALQDDLSVFKNEVQPWLWLSPGLGWIPTYGGDLAAVPDLLTLAEHLVNASSLSYQAAQPLLQEVDSQNSGLDPASLTNLLVQAQPQFGVAREELEQARMARNRIALGNLSPRLSSLLVEKVDPALKLLDESLALAAALPKLLGASAAEGPKTYLLLVENEDELRPTGGFITSVGNLVLHDGQVISLGFEEAGDLEDWSKPYPAAPWQLQEYMNSPVLTLRDSNWFTNFPTTAQWAEYLYAYTHAHSVDGVIAFDQQFLVMLLGVTGPLEVDGASDPITDKNVIEFMRQAKVPPADGPIPVDWYRKEFIGNIATAVLKEITGRQRHDWLGLVQVLQQALKERHLLLQLDDPTLAALIAERGWDNTVRPGTGDFLMVVDTNIGFNKTNAVVDISLSYDVNLTDLSAPVGSLIVTHKNKASPDVLCIQWNTGQITAERFYPIDRCYWNYLRVYREQGVKLLEANPHGIPGEWMLLGQGVPAQVDELEEKILGVKGFGTLLVVPGGQTLQTGFSFALPARVLSQAGGSGRFSYRLNIQKQPGTLANPLTIRIHLPNRAKLESSSLKVVQQDNNLLIETNLRTDVELVVMFSLP